MTLQVPLKTIPLLDYGFYRDHQKSGPTAPFTLLDHGSYWDHHKSSPTAPITPIRQWILGTTIGGDKAAVTLPEHGS